MAICKKCSKPYFHETNYENLCCKCYEKQKEKIYRELKNKRRDINDNVKFQENQQGIWLLLLLYKL